MKDLQNDIVIADENEVDVVHFIISTAIKSFYRFFVTFVLLVVLFFGAFPLKAMEFFENIGNYDRALYMVDMYISRNTRKNPTAFSNYADGIYYKIMLSEELVNRTSNKKNIKYLNSLYESTKIYSTIDGIEERNAIIDYNSLQYLTPFTHANVFSFMARVNALNYFASIGLDNENSFLIGDSFYQLEDVIEMVEKINSTLLLDELSSHSTVSLSALKLSIFFNQITELVQYRLSNIDNEIEGDNTLSNEDICLLLDAIEGMINAYEDFLLEYFDFYSSCHTDSLLYGRQSQLFLIRSLGCFYDEAVKMSTHLNYRADTWQSLRMVNLAETECTVLDYYITVLLPEYMSSFI